MVLVTVLGGCSVLGLVLVGSCLNKPRYECAVDTDCNVDGPNGACELTKFCSFPDSSCPSGRRYGDLSGPQANQCVGNRPDAAPDTLVVDAFVQDARSCFGSGAYQLCFASMPPMGTLQLAGTLDTGTDTRCMTMPTSWMTAGQPDACLVLGKTITVSSLLVSGSRPLVLLADTLTITGTLDVSSHRTPASAGPGAPSAMCGTATAPGDEATGAAGGAGGSFTSKGGDGGTGKNGAAASVAAPALGASPTVLRAGCSGRLGGMGMLSAGPAGRGGGAVFITASKITLAATAVINASGAGATGSPANPPTVNLSGGSGAGSGGMIVIHAAESITAMVGAKLVANGGGGASGASSSSGGAGNDPAPAMPTQQAAGGTTNNAGSGGAGFALGMAAGTGVDQGGTRDTGGGGGGGAGYIQINVAIANATFSPSPTVVP